MEVFHSELRGTSPRIGQVSFQGSDRFHSPSMFQRSSVRVSCNTSKVAFVLLTTSVCLVLGMTLPSAHEASLLVQRDDEKYNSLPSTKNRFGLHCLPSLFVSTVLPARVATR